MKATEKVIQVTDMRSLRREKARLKKLCGEMEQEGRDRLNHVKSHYGSMAFNAIFPNAHPETRLWKLLGYAVKSAWESDHFRSVIFTALITVLEFFGVRQGVKLFEKYFKKKKSKEEPEEKPPETE